LSFGYIKIEDKFKKFKKFNNNKKTLQVLVLLTTEKAPKTIISQPTSIQVNWKVLQIL